MKKLNQEDLKRKKAIEDFLEERTSINSEKSFLDKYPEKFEVWVKHYCR